MRMKNKEQQDIFQLIAKQQGISATEVRTEMKHTIEESFHSKDPLVREKFRLLFGNTMPTPEEFIYKVYQEIKEKHE